MHKTSHATMAEFVRVHLDDMRGTALEILDFGSQMVDGQELSYPGLLDDPAWHYRGLDIEAGVNVDIVVDDAYDWPHVPSDSVDLVISGQAFEHVEYFWASMFEIIRVLKPGGVATIIAPSSGFEHRYPVDCWRFYRDGFTALSKYVGVDLVDVFTDWDHGDWDDSIIVVEKPVWDETGRRRFAVRSAMQRALLADDPESFSSTDVPDPEPAGDVSALRGREVGALTRALEAKTVARLDAEREQAAVEEQQRAEARAAEIDAEVERRLNDITPVRWYGTARRAVANLVGERGRAAYRKLRGRG